MADSNVISEKKIVLKLTTDNNTLEATKKKLKSMLQDTTNMTEGQIDELLEKTNKAWGNIADMLLKNTKLTGANFTKELAKINSQLNNPDSITNAQIFIQQIMKAAEEIKALDESLTKDGSRNLRYLSSRDNNEVIKMALNARKQRDKVVNRKLIDNYFNEVENDDSAYAQSRKITDPYRTAITTKDEGRWDIYKELRNGETYKKEYNDTQFIDQIRKAFNIKSDKSNKLLERYQSDIASYKELLSRIPINEKSGFIDRTKVIDQDYLNSLGTEEEKNKYVIQQFTELAKNIQMMNTIIKDLKGLDSKFAKTIKDGDPDQENLVKSLFTRQEGFSNPLGKFTLGQQIDQTATYLENALINVANQVFSDFQQRLAIEISERAKKTNAKNAADIERNTSKIVGNGIGGGNGNSVGNSTGGNGSGNGANGNGSDVSGIGNAATGEIIDNNTDKIDKAKESYDRFAVSTEDAKKAVEELMAAYNYLEQQAMTASDEQINLINKQEEKIRELVYYYSAVFEKAGDSIFDEFSNLLVENGFDEIDDLFDKYVDDDKIYNRRDKILHTKYKQNELVKADESYLADLDKEIGFSLTGNGKFDSIVGDNSSSNSTKTKENIDEITDKVNNTTNEASEAINTATEKIAENVKETTDEIDNDIDDTEDNIESLGQSLNGITDESIKRLTSSFKELSEQLNVIIDQIDSMNGTINGSPSILYNIGKMDDFRYDWSTDKNGKPLKPSEYVDGWTAMLDDDKLKHGYNAMGYFGSGLYGTEDPKIVTDYASTKSKMPIQAIDISQYKLYKNRTPEQAKKLNDFLQNLQQYTIAQAGIHIPAFDEALKDVDIDSLVKQANELFGTIEHGKSRISEFIKEYSKLVSESYIPILDDDKNITGWRYNDDNAKNKELVNGHNIATQFLKSLGYEGVSNIGVPGYNNFTHGTVLFDYNRDENPPTRFEKGDIQGVLDYARNVTQRQHGEQVITDRLVQAINELSSQLTASIQSKDEEFKKSHNYHGISDSLISDNNQSSNVQINTDYVIAQMLDALTNNGNGFDLAINQEKLHSDVQSALTTENGFEVKLNLDDFTKSINEVLEKINTAIEKLHEANSTSNPNGAETPSEKEIKTESEALENLKKQVEFVKTAVEEKTQAFNNEKTATDSVVSSEVQEIAKLYSSIVQITDALNAFCNTISSISQVKLDNLTELNKITPAKLKAMTEYMQEENKANKKKSNKKDKDENKVPDESTLAKWEHMAGTHGSGTSMSILEKAYRDKLQELGMDDDDVMKVTDFYNSHDEQLRKLARIRTYDINGKENIQNWTFRYSPEAEVHNVKHGNLMPGDEGYVQPWFASVIDDTKFKQTIDEYVSGIYNDFTKELKCYIGNGINKDQIGDDISINAFNQSKDKISQLIKQMQLITFSDPNDPWKSLVDDLLVQMNDELVNADQRIQTNHMDSEVRKRDDYLGRFHQAASKYRKAKTNIEVNGSTDSEDQRILKESADDMALYIMQIQTLDKNLIDVNSILASIGDEKQRIDDNVQIEKEQKLVDELIKAYEKLYKLKDKARDTKVSDVDMNNVQAEVDKLQEKFDKAENNMHDSVRQDFYDRFDKLDSDDELRKQEEIIDEYIKAYENLYEVKTKALTGKATDEEVKTADKQFGEARDKYNTISNGLSLGRRHEIVGQMNSYKDTYDEKKQGLEDDENKKKEYKELATLYKDYMSNQSAVLSGQDKTGEHLEKVNQLLEQIKEKKEEIKQLDLTDVEYEQQLEDTANRQFEAVRMRQANIEAGKELKRRNGTESDFEKLNNNVYSYFYNLEQKATGKITLGQNGQIERFNKSVKDTFGELAEWDNQLVSGASATDVWTDSITKAETALTEFNQNKILNALDQSIAKLGDLTDEGKKKIEELQAQAKQLDFSGIFKFNDETKEFEIIDEDKLKKQITSLKELQKQASQAVKDTRNFYANDKDSARIYANYYSWRDRNPAAAEANPERFKWLDEQVEKLNSADRVSQAYLDNLDASIRKVEGDASKAGNTGLSFVDELGQRFKGLAQYALSFVSIYDIINKVREGISIVEQYDTAFTEMQKVSNESIESLREYADITGKVADQVGSTSITIQNSTADWQRLGYSIKDAGELAKNTAILMNVSEFDNISEATESMVSMVQAFKDVNSDVGKLSGDIIDKLNNIGNNYSISTSELAQSLQDSSGTLIAAGNDIDKAIALTTAGNAILQDPSKVSAGIRTISMRLRGTSVKELESSGEDTDGAIESIPKLKQKIEDLTAVNGKAGVSITKLNGQFKDTYEIMQEIADKWEEIGQVDAVDGLNRQAGILETVAGKNRSAIAASIFQNPDMLRSVYEDVQDSANSAQHENEIYLTSIEAHQKKLTNAWQEMWKEAINKDVINFFIDLGTSIINLTKNIGLLKVALAAIPASIGALAATRGNGPFGNITYDENGAIQNNYGWFKNAQGGFKENVKHFFSAPKYITRPSNISDEDLVKLFNQYQQDNEEGTLSGKMSYLRTAVQGETAEQANARQYNLDMAAYVATTDKASQSLEDFNEQQRLKNINMNKGTLATIAATAKQTLFNFAITAGTTLLIELVASLALKAWDDYAHRVEHAKEAMDDANQSLTEINDTYKNQKQTVEDLSEKYIELKKGVDDSGRNVSLTKEQYQEFLDVNNQLADALPSLERTYNSNGDALVDLGRDAEDVTDKLQSLLDTEQNLNNEKIADDLMPKIVKGINVTTDEYNEQIQDIVDDITVDEPTINKIKNGTIKQDLTDIINGNTVDGISEDMINRYLEALEEAGMKYNSDFSYEQYNDPNTLGTDNTMYKIIGRANPYRTDLADDRQRAIDGLDAFIGDVMNDAVQELDEKYNEKADLMNEREASLNPLRSILASYMQTSTEYNVLGEQGQIEADQLLGKVDLLSLVNKNYSSEQYQEYIKDNILDTIQWLSQDEELNNLYLGLLDGQNALENGKYSVNDYNTAMAELLKNVAGKYSEDSEQYSLIQSMFNDEDIPQIQRYKGLVMNELNDLYKKIAEKSNDSNMNTMDNAMKLIDSLSDVDQAILLSSDMAGQYIEELSREFSDPADVLDKTVQRLKGSSSEIKQILDELSTKSTNLSTLTTDSNAAIAEQNNQGYLSDETVSKIKSELESLGYSTESVALAFEHVYGGMRLNNEMFNVMLHNGASKYVKELSAAYDTLNLNYDDQNKRLNDLKDNLEKAKVATKNDTDYVDENSDGVNDNVKVIEDKINATRQEISTTEEQMARYRVLIDQYDQMNNAYQRLTTALSSPNQGARYDTVRNAKDQVEKLAKNNQWGTDDVIEWINYWTGVDTTNASLDEEARMYKVAAANAKKYSTEDYTGVKNLYTDITNLAGTVDTTHFVNGKYTKSMTYDRENDVLQINDIKQAAQDAGLSVSALVDILDKMKEFKLNVDYDTSQAGLAKIEENAEDLENKLTDLETQRTLGLMVDPKMDTTELDKLIKDTQRQLEVTKLSIKLGVDASDVISQMINVQKQINELNKSDAPEQEKYQDRQALIKKRNELAKNAGMTDDQIQQFVIAYTDQGKDDVESGIEQVKAAAGEETQLNIQTTKAKDDLISFQNRLNQVLKNFEPTYELKVKMNHLDLLTPKEKDYTGKNNKPNYSFANGQNNNGYDGKTLVGEEGEELRYSKQTGTWDMLGANGPELRDDVTSSDVIFNHKQTEGILKNKNVDINGNSFANGQNNYGLDDKILDWLYSEMQEKLAKWPQDWSDIKNVTRDELAYWIANPYFGNIDMTTRQVNYEDSTGEYNTVLGSGEKNWNGYAISFSPMVQNANGQPTMLDDETLNWYIDNLTSNAKSPQELLEMDHLGLTDGAGLHVHDIVGSASWADDDNIAPVTTKIDELMHFVGEYYDIIGKNKYWNEFVQTHPNMSYSNVAFADGQNNALIGEEAPEILVRNGRWQLMGTNGAEMFHPQPNDIIFNAEQTKDLMTEGHTNSRGKAFVDGNAFESNELKTIPQPKHDNDTHTLSGNAKILENIGNNLYTGIAGLTNATNNAKNNLDKNTAATQENTDELEATKKKFDWATQRITMLDKRRTWVENDANDTYASYDDRMAKYDELRQYDQDIIQASNENYEIRYKELGEADAKLVEVFGQEMAQDLITKVRNGSTDINDYLTNLKLDPLPDNATDAQKKAHEAQEKIYNKQVDAIQADIDAMETLTDAINKQYEAEERAREDAKKQYQLDIDRIQNSIDEFGQQITHVQSTINIKNTSGGIVTAGDYNRMIAASGNQISSYYDQIARMEERLSKLSEDSEDSEEYYQVASAINQCKAAIDSARQSQAEWAEAIANMPVDHIKAYIENIKTAQSALDDYVSELEAAGKKIDEKVLKQGVEIQKKLAEEYSAEIELLQEKIARYTPGSDQWNSTFLSIESVADAISDVNQKLIAYNKQLLNISVDKLTDTATQLKNIKDGLDAIQTDNLTTIQTAISIIEDNAEKLTKPLSDQLELLQKQNAARQDELSIEQAQWNLQKARDQKQVQTVRNGKLVYESDSENLRNAQNALREAEDQKRQNDLQRQIDAINKKAEDQEDKWKKIQSDTQLQIDTENAAKLNSMTPEEFANKIKSGNDQDLYEKTKKSYEDTAEQNNNISKMSEDLDKVVQLLTQINEMYIKGAITSAQAQTMYDNVINRSKDGFTGEEYSKSRLELEQKESPAKAIEDATKQIADTKAELDTNYKTADETQKLIDKYSKSYDELTKKIAELIALATEAYKNTKDAEDVAYNVSGYGGKLGMSFASLNSDESKRELHPTSVYQRSYTDENGYVHDVYKAYDRHGKETNGFELYDTGKTAGKNIIVNYLDENGNVAYSKDYGNIVTKKYVTGVDSNGQKYGYSVNLNGSDSKYYSTKYNGGSSSSSSSSRDSGGSTTTTKEVYSHEKTTIVHNGNDSNHGGPGWQTMKSGIENGAVHQYGSAKNDNERVKLLQQLSTREIKPEEVPILMHVGEIVLNPEQQARLLNNVSKLPSVPNNAVSNATSIINSTPVSISMGNIELHEVNDANALANAITQQFAPAMAQAFSTKFKK